MITIRTIPHEAQRYPTVGDWEIDSENIVITVSDMGDPRKEFLIGLHELVEVFLCQSRGITQACVDKFDQAFTSEGEPGDDPASPYSREHCFATGIERLLCAELGLSWAEYDGQIEALYEGAT